MISLAKFILNTKHEYNGHKQTRLVGLTLGQGLKLARELEELLGKFVVLEVWDKEHFDIIQKDHWKQG